MASMIRLVTTFHKTSGKKLIDWEMKRESLQFERDTFNKRSGKREKGQ